ncbi:MAG: hypothetical protein JNK53_04485 [Phycisphaerae bacterium]|nr:hypothetical protein [Phycisphaerae bacterium]
MKHPIEHAADAWLAAESSGTAFEASGEWGTASGTITAPANAGKRGWLMGALRSESAPTVVLVVPNLPGLENDEPRAVIEDAMSAGFIRGGAHVARVREFTLRASAYEDASAYVDAALGMAAAALAALSGARLALAGVGLAGATAAAASGQRTDVVCLALVAAPAPEILCRRTPDDEDDGKWKTSKTLRLAESLSHAAPLEAIVQQRRPVLLVNGAVDDELPALHMEAWRAALAAGGRGVDAVEVAFADSLLRWCESDGSVVRGATQAHDLLADIVGRWTVRTIRSRSG